MRKFYLKYKSVLIVLISISNGYNILAQDTLSKSFESIEYYKNGKIRTIIHSKNGRWNGECIWKDSLGRMQSKETYLNGNKVGLAEYYQDGKIQISGNYIKYGIREGEWTYYKKNEEIDKIFLYRNDSVIRHFELDNSGNRFELIYYKTIEEAKKNPLTVYYLDLRSQRLKTFPEDILLFKNLRYLDLSAYDINGTDSAQKYFDSLFTYERSLPRHSTYDPYIPIGGAYNRNVIKSIPVEIAILKSLKSINLFDTNINRRRARKLKKYLPKDCVILSEYTIDDY